MSAWQPIETAPKDDEPILACLGELRFIVRWLSVPELAVSGWSLDLGGEDYCAMWADKQPTHWMPLPKSPTEELPDG